MATIAASAAALARANMPRPQARGLYTCFLPPLWESFTIATICGFMLFPEPTWAAVKVVVPTIPHEHKAVLGLGPSYKKPEPSE